MTPFKQITAHSFEAQSFKSDSGLSALREATVSTGTL